MEGGKLGQLHGLHSLSAIHRAASRKPLRGYGGASELIHFASPAAPPSRQPTLTAFLAKPDAAAPPDSPRDAQPDTPRPPSPARGFEAAGGAEGSGGGMPLEVFEDALERVWRRDARTLLSPEERGWVGTLHPRLRPEPLPALSPRARALYARLFGRKPVAFRAASLAYAEVGDVLGAARELDAARLVQLVGGGARPTEEEWACGWCTLRNAPARRRCAACDNPREGGAHGCTTVRADAASLALELLGGAALRDVCATAGIASKSGAGRPGGFGAASEAHPDEGPSEGLRRRLREKLGLPHPRVRGGGAVGCDSGAAARLRAAQADAVLSKAFRLLGSVIVLHEEPLAVFLRCERLAFGGSYCDGTATAAAAAMGCAHLRAASYEITPAEQLAPSLPSRGVLLRLEAAEELAGVYLKSLSAEETSRPAQLAAHASDTLRAIVDRIHATPPSCALDAEAEEAVAGAEVSAFTQALRAICDATGVAIASSLHPAEAEGWAALRAARPLAARLSIGWVCASLLTLHVSLLERRRQYAAAASLLPLLLASPFCPRRRGHWWTRLCIDRDHIARGGRLPLLREALADAAVRGADRIGLTRRAHRLGERRADLPAEPPVVRVRGRPLRHGGGGRVVYVAEDDEAGQLTCAVEQLVLQEYARVGGWRGVHCETGAPAALFALLCWELIFMPVADAFESRFQDAPLDLAADGGEFAAARREALAARLDVLAGMSGWQLHEEVIRSHQAHAGERCRGVSWTRWGDSEELAEMAGCLGGGALATICRAFAEDYCSWHGGMPDLIVWRRREEGGGGYGEARLVEVKSPSDKLSDQQRAWIHLLRCEGVRVEVCRVLPDVQTDAALIAAEGGGGEAGGCHADGGSAAMCDENSPFGKAGHEQSPASARKHPMEQHVHLVKRERQGEDWS
ncbi:hypothetical protein AB1Y20_014044 [Prymnesium parvum]|uniref:Fanconi-associated nuclease n=1 Tax=Prymnesium parvum TaxID=97485 RepID=A0AB34IH65_PRYPA